MPLSDASTARCSIVLSLPMVSMRNMQQLDAGVKIHAEEHMLRSARCKAFVCQRKSHAVRGWPYGRVPQCVCFKRKLR